MPTNKRFDELQLSVTPTNPVAGAAVGAPVRVGSIVGVALTSLAGGGNIATQQTVDFGAGVWAMAVHDTVGGGVAIGDPVFYADGAPGELDNTTTNYFFGYALAIVGVGATTTINVLHAPSPGSGTLGAGTIGTANLAAGILSADAPGRAKMSADYFDAATFLAKHGTDSITNAVLLKAVLDGAFQNDAATRALFADAIWTEAKLALASLTGAVAAVNATENVIGSIPVYHRFTIPDVGAPTDYSITLTHKTLITQWWIQNTGIGAHNTDDTINLKNVAASISGAVPKTNVVNGVIRPTTMDSANCLVTAGNVLKVTATKATNIACIVHVLGVRSA